MDDTESRAAGLGRAVRDARSRTLEIVADLTDDQLLGPRLAIVNPLRWEIGHVAWFQEYWTLRGGGRRPSLRGDADALYDSMKVAHDTRWDLPLPTRAQTLAYLRDVRDRVLERLESRAPAPTPDDLYFVQLTVFHEDMHDEAFTYARQTLGYPPPRLFVDGSFPPAAESGSGGPLRGDVLVPGGAFALGADPGESFVFDNEKWAHEIEVATFAIARAPVTQSEFAAFVEDGGYARADLWSGAGWRWREAAAADHPRYWRPRDARSAAKAPLEGGEACGTRWLRRDFDRWVPLEPHRPVIHVNWFEAQAYCRWAGRRLPREGEWEMAAAWDPAAGRKRRYPWGDDPPGPERANLDWRSGGCLDVGALPAGDSALGCRQMLGNVWEWTEDDFTPYPGFEADPYKEYSEPWFSTHKVLRGGCWATRSRLIRSTWRNFYEPDRSDVWAGFRTCAL